MRSLIIYCSDYKNNSEKIARIFAEKTDSELITQHESLIIFSWLTYIL
jgi:flavodoxin